MSEEPFDSERPRDESWWERELHRNEKLMDKYMAVLGDNPDWDKWRNPEDLYNKVHFNIDPPERAEDEEEEPDEGSSEAESKESKATAQIDDDSLDEMEITEESLDDSDWEDPDEDPEVNEDYESVARQARDFACHVFDLEKLPMNGELLFLSAGKVGANLAGGHGLGYDDESICGNIVKCRWALSDCEFCREMLEQLHQKTSQAIYDELAQESRKLAELIRDRIARLRKRVWW